MSSRVWVSRIAVATAGVGGVGVLVAQGRLTVDLGVGRRTRRLGPIELTIDAPAEVVFDVIAGPYRRTPRAIAGKLSVWERGEDTVLAEHLTKLGPLTASTVELVRFERPQRITFRLVRGPVPYAVERYELHERDGGTRFVYSGELGADLWALGDLALRRAVPLWERTVADSLARVVGEAERRAARGRTVSP